jgi:hypothetical protein
MVQQIAILIVQNSIVNTQERHIVRILYPVMFCGLGARESAAAAGEQQESTARTTIIYLLYCDVMCCSRRVMFIVNRGQYNKSRTLKIKTCCATSVNHDAERNTSNWLWHKL